MYIVWECSAHKVKRPWQGWKCLLTLYKRQRRKEERKKEHRAHREMRPCFLWLFRCALFFSYLFCHFFLYIHVFLLYLSLKCEATVSQFYPWISSDRYAYIERWSVGRNTSHSVTLRYVCACVCVYVSVCECISLRCHFLWFVYQCSSHGCLFKVHNDVHTCIQNTTCIVNHNA